MITSSRSLTNYNACKQNMRDKSNYWLNRKSKMCSPLVQLHEDFHSLIGWEPTFFSQRNKTVVSESFITWKLLIVIFITPVITSYKQIGYFEIRKETKHSKNLIYLIQWLSSLPNTFKPYIYTASVLKTLTKISQE